MTQITAQTRDEVMTWVETTPHHIANKEDPKVFILKGHNDILRVPIELWNKCFIKPGGEFDSRMYRWDFETHKKKVLSLRLKRSRPKPKAKKVAKPRFAEKPNLDT